MSSFSIFVNGIGLTGSIKIDGIEPTTTVKQIKKKIFDKECIPVRRQKLIFTAKTLQDAHKGRQMTVKDYQIRSESTIYLVISLKGGRKVQVKLLNQKVLNIELKPSETVGAFKTRVANLDKNLSASRMNLNFAGLAMEDHNSMDLYFAKFGPKDALVIEQTKARLQEGSHPGLVVSFERCCITRDDDESEARAKMPCGHVISVEGMTGFMRSQLANNVIYQILCPSKKPNGQDCQEPWEYELCREVGVFTGEECKEFEGKLGRNYAKKEMSTQECVTCKSYLARETKELMTKCLYCEIKNQGFAFCWTCKRKWNGSDRMTCGYVDCGSTADILQKCTTKTIDFGCKITDVPIYRRCPWCLTQVIEHRSECKHMKCLCKKEFCFVCLKKKVDGSWQCGSAGSECSVAPRQT